MTESHTLWWWTLRTVRDASDDGKAFDACYLQATALPKPKSWLHNLGGRTQALYLDIDLSGTSIHLDRIDPLLEACWVSGLIWIEEDGRTTSQYHSFTRNDLEIDRILIPDLGFSQDLRPSDIRPRIVKYLIKIDFAVPQMTPLEELANVKPNVNNDVVFLFPFEFSRMPKRLWGNIGQLSRLSPYFDQLFRSPFCASHNITQNLYKSFSDLTSAYRTRQNASGLPADDSDRDENANPIGHLRKPRWMNIASSCTGTARYTRFVIIKHHSYRSFRLCLHYLDTGYISSLAILRSARHMDKGDGAEGHLAASPKSVYRLAAQLQLGPVMTSAVIDIQCHISSDNFFTELMSPYVVLFPQLTEAVIAGIVGDTLLLEKRVKRA